MSGVSTATAVSAGSFHTCVILADTTARCSGHNFKGKLGDGTTVDRTTPVAVSGLTGVATISAGFGHTCASKTDLTVWCWGNDFEGAVGGADSTTPVQISG